jgi:hypothetical protein
MIFPLLEAYQTSNRVVPEKTSISKKAILTLCLEPQSLLEIMGQLNYKHRTYLRSRHLIPLIEAGLLKLTNPAKPRSSRQKYLTTTKGKEYIEKIQDDDQVSY